MDVSELFKAVDEMDGGKFVSFLTEDANFKYGNADVVVGREAIKKSVSDFFNLIKGLSHNIINSWKIDDKEIIQGEVTYIRKDGSKVTFPFVNIFTFKGDLIKEYLVYIDIGPLFQSN